MTEVKRKFDTIPVWKCSANLLIWLQSHAAQVGTEDLKSMLKNLPKLQIIKYLFIKLHYKINKSKSRIKAIKAVQGDLLDLAADWSSSAGNGERMAKWDTWGRDGGMGEWQRVLWPAQTCDYTENHLSVQNLNNCKSWKRWWGVSSVSSSSSYCKISSRKVRKVFS